MSEVLQCPFEGTISLYCEVATDANEKIGKNTEKDKIEKPEKAKTSALGKLKATAGDGKQKNVTQKESKKNSDKVAKRSVETLDGSVMYTHTPSIEVLSYPAAAHLPLHSPTPVVDNEKKMKYAVLMASLASYPADVDSQEAQVFARWEKEKRGKGEKEKRGRGRGKEGGIGKRERGRGVDDLSCTHPSTHKHNIHNIQSYTTYNHNHAQSYTITQHTIHTTLL
jgi:hypothetical protein